MISNIKTNQYIVYYAAVLTEPHYGSCISISLSVRPSMTCTRLAHKQTGT